MLVQFLATAVVIAVLILVLPGIELHAAHRLLAVLWLAVVFGVVSALIRPALEFLFLPYVMQSLGLVVVAINAILLALLGLTSVLKINGVLPLLAGAVLAGLVGLFLDSILGLTPPVVDDPTARVPRGERAVGLATVSERLRVIQLRGILLQYAVEFAFDWQWLRPFRRRMQSWLWQRPVPAARLPAPVKARLLLEELGPTYVKLGQIVSSQSRVLPLEWEEELAKLQSEVRPFPYGDVRDVITASLGEPPETLYRLFNPEPLAAASLAQVHEATTHDGRRVAVKVQRPNIHEQLRSDITILTRAAAVLERRAEWAADADLTGVVHEFGSTLLRELDYTIEAYNTRRLAHVLEGIDGVHVPWIEQTLSTDRVLTLEFVEGVKSTQTSVIDAAGIDRKEIVRNFVRGAVQMLMIDGFFHADPHPGNVVVEIPGGQMTFLDAGMIGELDLQKRISLARFLLAFRDKDVETLATTLRSLSEPFRTPDDKRYRQQFRQRIGPLIDLSAGAGTAQLQKLVSEALDVLRSSGYRLDPQLTLAMKAVAQAEEITIALTPEADAVLFAELGGAALEELVPKALGERRVAAGRTRAIQAAVSVIDHLPAAREAVGRWAGWIEKAEIPVSVHVADLERTETRLESVARLLAVAIILTGTIIGSALAASIDVGTSALRADLRNAGIILFVIAMASAALLAGTLLWRLIRPDRRRRRRA